MAKWVDLTFVRGDTQTLKFKYVDDAGDAYDLTNWKSFFTIKKFIDDEEDDENAVFQDVVSTIVNPEQGIIEVVLTNAAVQNLLDKYYFDHQIVNKNSGEVITPWIGSITFVRDTTRSV